jgi:hypothetical protein
MRLAGRLILLLAAGEILADRPISILTYDKTLGASVGYLHDLDGDRVSKSEGSVGWMAEEQVIDVRTCDPRVGGFITFPLFRRLVSLLGIAEYSFIQTKKKDYFVAFRDLVSLETVYVSRVGAVRGHTLVFGIAPGLCLGPVEIHLGPTAVVAWRYHTGVEVVEQQSLAEPETERTYRETYMGAVFDPLRAQIGWRLGRVCFGVAAQPLVRKIGGFVGVTLLTWR